MKQIKTMLAGMLMILVGLWCFSNGNASDLLAVFGVGLPIAGLITFLCGWLSKE